LSGSGKNWHQESQKLYEELILQPGKVSNPKASKAQRIILEV
jgi:hypothetical protein